MTEFPDPRPVNILGTRVTATTLDRAVELLAERVRERTPAYVCVCPVHTVVEGLQRPEVRRAVNGAWLATTDGMPLVWWARRAGAGPLSRVYGPDLLRRTVTSPLHAETRHYFYGATPPVVAALVAALRRDHPGLRVAGTASPPFRDLTAAEERDALAAIDAARPDIVWVGLGCPKQELWMARVRSRLAAPLLIGVGAAFDFLSGSKPQAPGWMQRSGLEWLFRLASEPRRLWRRYLVYNAKFRQLRQRARSGR